MDKTYSCIDAKEVATNRAPNDNIEGSDKFNKTFSWDHNKGKKKNWDMFSPYKGSNHGILRFLVKIPWEILATEKAAKAFEPHPSMVGNKRSCDMSKSCQFYEDHGHETNQYRELRHKIKEAMKIGQLAHLVKGIKNGKEKTSDTQQVVEGHKKIKESGLEVPKDVLRCSDGEERIIVNDYYPEQTVVIGKQLPTNFKRKLQELLQANADVFTWIYAGMI
ncbi:hypothetical protein Tco_1297397 [Tanacetum coccineum]